MQIQKYERTIDEHSNIRMKAIRHSSFDCLVVRLFCLSLISLFPYFLIPSIAQSAKIDSLQKLLLTQKEDTNKANTLNALSWELKSTNFDTAILLSTQALVISTQSDAKGKQSPPVQKLIANSLGNLGAFNYLKGNYPQALQYYFKALEINEGLKDKNGIAKSLGNIGSVYYSQGDYPKAFDYYFKVLKIAEEFGNKQLEEKILGNIGSVYSSQGDYPKALDYYFMALKMREELGAKNIIASCLGNIGVLYLKEKKFSAAEKYLNNALSLSKELGDKEGMKEDYQNLSALDSTLGNYKSAYSNYKMYIIYRDSINNEENTKRQTRTEMQYEFDKKEAKAKAEVEKREAIQKAENNSLVSSQWIVVSCFVCIVYLPRLQTNSKEEQRNNRTETSD